MQEKVEELLSRLPELEQKLGQPDVFDDQKRYRELTQEHRYLQGLQETWDQYSKAKSQLDENTEMLDAESDEEFRAVLEEDISKLQEELPGLETRLHNLLVPPDPNDSRNTIVEIRAGTGGDEAALFVGDCVRMYKLFCERMSWKYEEMASSESEVGGYKEYVMILSGENVHRFMQYEGGTHRVQRVPETETQGRIHTSAVTVAILLEPDEEEDIDLEEKDLRVDTYRASGAGGQHVNTTDSAVRITHIPTGIVAYCSEERSQHKNRAKAMRLLKAKIIEIERQQKQAEISSSRSAQVGSGDRSERIRTYNFPQNRLSDHRINFTRYNLDHVMQGDLEEVTSELVAHFYQEKLNNAG